MASKIVPTKLKSIALHLLAFVLVLSTAWFTPQIRNLDKKLNDIALQALPSEIVTNIVLIDIDQKAINTAKSFPVSRSFIADAINGIANQNPSRVIVDILFIADGNTEDDQKLIDALNQFKPDTLAIAGINGSSTIGRPSPNPKFRNNITVFNSAILPDSDGFYRRIGNSQSTQTGFVNPARWLAGERGTSSLIIDQSIPVKNYSRYSMADFLDGQGPDLTGKLVVVGQISQLLGLPVFYPLLGTMDRVEFIALGTDTLLHGNEKYELSSLQNLVMIALISLLAFYLAQRLVNNRNILLVSIFASIAIVVANLIALNTFNISLNIIISVLTWKAAVFLTAIYKYRFLDAAREVMSGDLSPEEAWQWRLMKEHSDPFLLLGMSGLRRANKAALTMGIPDEKNYNINRIQKLAMNMQGKNEETITFNLNGEHKVFKILQPFKKIDLFQLQDITNERLEIDRLATVAITDGLTRCLNKAGFEDIIQKVESNNKDYAIFILDLNGFKLANDTFGHQVGDKVLVECAKRFNDVIRNTDELARIGGDEFAVMISADLNSKELLQIRNNLENSLADNFNIDGQTIAIGVSVGFARRKDNENTTTLMAAADKAMYERKTFLKSSGKAIARAT